jgi:hypothetical protein
MRPRKPLFCPACGHCSKISSDQFSGVVSRQDFVLPQPPGTRQAAVTTRPSAPSRACRPQPGPARRSNEEDAGVWWFRDRLRPSSTTGGAPAARHAAVTTRPSVPVESLSTSTGTSPQVERGRRLAVVSRQDFVLPQPPAEHPQPGKRPSPPALLSPSKACRPQPGPARRSNEEDASGAVVSRQDFVLPQPPGPLGGAVVSRQDFVLPQPPATRSLRALDQRPT